jgi:hypothetical protein
LNRQLSNAKKPNAVKAHELVRHKSKNPSSCFDLFHPDQLVAFAEVDRGSSRELD